MAAAAEANGDDDDEVAAAVPVVAALEAAVEDLHRVNIVVEVQRRQPVREHRRGCRQRPGAGGSRSRCPSPATRQEHRGRTRGQRL